jgi:diguanylate cyclase (GGDEF)-like protein
MARAAAQIVRRETLSPEIIADEQMEMVDFGQVFLRARRMFLDALPFPGALFAKLGRSHKLVDCNAGFRALSEGQAFFDGTELRRELTRFLAGTEPLADYAWQDDDPVLGRSYTIRFSRLKLAISDAPACLVTLIDTTAERAAQKSLRLEMFNDSLTGLPNRLSFGDTLGARLASGDETLAVLVLDLTRFGRVNDSMGAIAGDELLITVARRLLSAIRAGDLLARIGGDEFAVLIHAPGGATDAAMVADRIAEALAGPCRLSDLEIRVGCAIGCAVSEPDCDADELIRRAQFALKRAKDTGDTEFYQPRAHDMARRSFTIETALRRAIEADRLTLALQPVIDLSTGAVASFEALARWQEDGEAISPGTFIPVAEESGLIVPLGRWAMHAALKTLASWDARGARFDARIAVNVSAIQIARDDVPRLVADALSATRIEPGRLMLELTESAIVADPERAAQALHQVREIGPTLALDDFGTGYSNLAYLQRMPIDILKIDQSFVTGMLGDRDKIAIVGAILSLADALGLRTTAEGVETEQLAQTLAALGCTQAQGYFYAPPLSEDDAFAYWSRSNSAAT